MVTRYERHLLKVHKRENFPLAFFTLTEPIWIGDLGTGETIDFFFILPLISRVFVAQNLKFVVVGLGLNVYL
jgi:hypothetical protein